MRGFATRLSLYAMVMMGAWVGMSMGDKPPDNAIMIPPPAFCNLQPGELPPLAVAKNWHLCKENRPMADDHWHESIPEGFICLTHVRLTPYTRKVSKTLYRFTIR